ncbi:23S rRNA (pseudouridine(1915)-N(3))-methyltransferase RlmH [Paenibacillus germinis]|uniref:23S rRNA (pseudouridine(1915)-N(3))-methyltransferase RlmH n=1 Tax=Paenibacillus germinis TaxID=2654979 RepID=UPI0035E40E97
MRRIGPYAKVQMIEVPDDKAPENMCPAEEQQLMRLVLMEQVNRMVRINRGEPYHK